MRRRGRAAPSATATVSIGSSTISPYSVTWSSQPADGAYKVVARATDNAGNTTDSAAVAVTVDNTSPVHGLTMASGGSGAYLLGTTMYFKGNAAGSFILNDTLTDVTSGPASVDYPDIATAGWTHAVESTSTGPSYASSTFLWTASPSTPSGYVVTGHDVAGNTATLPVTFVERHDGAVRRLRLVRRRLLHGRVGAGHARRRNRRAERRSTPPRPEASCSSARARRSRAAPAEASAGSRRSPRIRAASATDNGVASGNCYRYRYVVLDNVGNSVTYTSGATVKVDTDAPNAFSLSAPAAGFVGPSATVSATGVDTGGSGIAQIEFRYCAGGSCSFASGTTIGSAGADVGLRVAVVGSLQPDGRRDVHRRRARDRRGREHDRLGDDDGDARRVAAGDERQRARAARSRRP